MKFIRIVEWVRSLWLVKKIQFCYSLVETKMSLIRQLNLSYRSRNVEVRIRYFLSTDVVVNVASFSDVLFSG